MKDYKLKIFNTFGFDADIRTNKPTELYIDLFPRSVKGARETKRILLLLEPPEISSIYPKDIISDSKRFFDYVLTHNEDILKNCNNSILHEFGTSWIKDFEFNDKSHCVTSLIGGKSFTPNHKMRHQLLKLKNLDLPIKVDLFNSKNTPLKDCSLLQMKETSRKNELFYSEFHICIENTNRNNWFTEKLIDCFQTKTIPIYNGCPNIENWFDQKGIIRFSTFEELINILNNIDDYKYENMIEAIEYNYERSKEFVDFGKRLSKKMHELKI